MGRLFFDSEEKGTEVQDGNSIIPVCKENGVTFSCQDGLCGSCVIKIVAGQENLSSPSLEEEDFFGNINTERLACQCTLLHGEVCIKK